MAKMVSFSRNLGTQDETINGYQRVISFEIVNLANTPSVKLAPSRGPMLGFKKRPAATR